ncbi:LCP family protein [Georgenia sp. Z1344]|uniref:LCP family protein n=1 Tax=Georgenia sp. Z1344 TaxID=3416706 RepID=UPI003CE680F9
MPPDAEDGAAEPETPREEPYQPRHRKPAPAQRRRRRGPIIAGAATAVVAVGIGAVAAMYNDLQGNITTEDVTHLLDEDERPTVVEDPDDPNAGQAMNILVMGSDTREGANSAQGGQEDVEGMRSDTTMIVHISSDRERVDIVSIPRDTLVPIPSCTLEDGSETEPVEAGMFNSAFHTGGQHGDVSAAAACTIATVEGMSDVRIDDYMVVDFAGFIGVVEALDGVPMYVDEDIDDPGAGLELDEGCQILDGEEALGYARARQTLGDGSDISRIGRQQQLVSAIARDVLSSRVLFDLPRLYSVLDAGTQTLTTSPEFGSIRNLAGLAVSLRGLEGENIGFLTMPWEPAGYRVTPTEEADDVWAALREDEPIPGTTAAADPELGGGTPTDESNSAGTGESASEGASEGASDGAAPEETGTAIGTGGDLAQEARDAVAAEETPTDEADSHGTPDDAAPPAPTAEPEAAPLPPCTR